MDIDAIVAQEQAWLASQEQGALGDLTQIYTDTLQELRERLDHMPDDTMTRQHLQAIEAQLDALMADMYENHRERLGEDLQQTYRKTLYRERNAWIHLETFAAWNDVPYSTGENGLAERDVTLKIDAPIFVKHFQQLADLQRDGVFRYGGRTLEARNLFFSGTCAMLTESSGSIGDVAKSGIDAGVGMLPYDPDAPGAPQNTIPGGASLWVMAGHSAARCSLGRKPTWSSAFRLRNAVR